MLQRDAGGHLTDDRLRNDLLPGQKAPPLPPLQFVVEDTGSGVRITVVNDGPLGKRLNGAIRYDAYFAETVDTTTAAGKAAGFARATCLAPSIPATDVAHTQSSALFQDPKFASGYFYVCGVGSDGERSAPTEPARVTRGPVDTTIPGDTKHLQISESGQVANGTVFSELSVTCIPPDDTSNFGGVQLYLKDYTALGEIQEGFYHHWLGSGAIDFDVLYDIPRRRGGFSVTATNGSASVTAASGLLEFVQPGDQLELMGQRITVDAVTDTTLTLHSNWPLPNVATSDWSTIALVTIYVVSIGKSGSRRADIAAAPSVAVLMDGNISTPNAPAQLYLTNAGVAALIEWDQVAGSTIDGYNVYRSAGAGLDAGMANSPPTPAADTLFLHKVPQNVNLPTGSTYARMQYPDAQFTLYDLENNNPFTWYVTTTNTRGDESAASSIAGNCRQSVTGEIDPTQVGRNPGKNYLYNAALAGTVNNQVSANDNSQDSFMGADALNLPGRPYGAASGQVNGTGKFRGYTRFESSDGGTGAAGTVQFKNGDEVHIPAPGSAKDWFVYEEIGAWEESSGNTFKKIAKGEVYTISIYLSHTGTTPDGNFRIYAEQYDNNTFKAQSLRRFRDSSSNLVTDATALDITTSGITATPTRYQAAFQFDSSVSPTRQVRINFNWNSGTAGVIVIRRVMVNAGEAAAQWTADMGDTNISIPVPTNPLAPQGDKRTERTGEGRRERTP